MCGIAGFIGNGDTAVLAAMTRRFSHRGPDGEGFFQEKEEKIYLGHRRLSIVDLSDGSQPMTTYDGLFTIVFNGEIYNHRELRDELKARGHIFRTHHSDTEVLLESYRAWGPEMLVHLNGMFTLALFDHKKRKLFLARDRFGEKPLYYFLSGGTLAFASELSALRLHPSCPNQISQTSLLKFLAYGYIPAPYTILEKCQKLPAGHAATFDLSGRALSIWRYWRFAIQEDTRPITAQGLKDYGDELSALLHTSVKNRLDCDVPYGILLSGGLDSGIIAALAKRQSASRLSTFSIGFKEKNYDESVFANQLATYLQTDQNLKMVSIDDLRDQALDYLSSLDEPLGDASYLPTSLVCEEARKKVKVALSGDGGDELFYGYDPFAALQTAGFVDCLVPRLLLSVLKRLTEALPRSPHNMSFDFKARRFLQGFEVPAALRLPCWMAPLSPAQLSHLFGRPIAAEEVYSEALDVWNESSASNVYDRVGEFFTRIYLPDNILMKTDRASMRVGLELRAPLLDVKIADFCMRLPLKYKIHRGTRKYLLKYVARGLIPNFIIDRPKKGFGIPLAAWMCDRKTMQPAETSFFKDTFARLWERHETGKEDWRYALWCDVVMAKFSSGQF